MKPKQPLSINFPIICFETICIVKSDLNVGLIIRQTHLLDPLLVFGRFPLQLLAGLSWLSQLGLIEVAAAAGGRQILLQLSDGHLHLLQLSVILLSTARETSGQTWSLCMFTVTHNIQNHRGATLDVRFWSSGARVFLWNDLLTAAGRVNEGLNECDALRNQTRGFKEWLKYNVNDYWLRFSLKPAGLARLIVLRLELWQRLS